MLAAKERFDRFYQPIVDSYHAKYEEGANAVKRLETELRRTQERLKLE